MKMSMWTEFKDFAIRGNVIDLAVGLIIGGAFTKIVSSLVSDVVMPPLGLLMTQVDFNDLAWILQEQTADREEITIRVGQFLNALIDFVLVAFAVFLVVKQINRMKRQETPPPPSSKSCPYCITVIDVKATRCPNCTSEVT